MALVCNKSGRKVVVCTRTLILLSLHLIIRGTGKNSNMRGHANFLGGFEKIEGEGFQGACYRGVYLLLFSFGEFDVSSFHAKLTVWRSLSYVLYFSD